MLLHSKAIDILSSSQPLFDESLLGEHLSLAFLPRLHSRFRHLGIPDPPHLVGLDEQIARRHVIDDTRRHTQGKHEDDDFLRKVVTHGSQSVDDVNGVVLLGKDDLLPARAHILPAVGLSSRGLRIERQRLHRTSHVGHDPIVRDARMSDALVTVLLDVLLDAIEAERRVPDEHVECIAALVLQPSARSKSPHLAVFPKESDHRVEDIKTSQCGGQIAEGALDELERQSLALLIDLACRHVDSEDATTIVVDRLFSILSVSLQAQLDSTPAIQQVPEGCLIRCVIWEEEIAITKLPIGVGIDFVVTAHVIDGLRHVTRTSTCHEAARIERALHDLSFDRSQAFEESIGAAVVDCFEFDGLDGTRIDESLQVIFGVRGHSEPLDKRRVPTRRRTILLRRKGKRRTFD